MNVSLTPELERLVHRKVKSGEYQTASEVIREGLRLIKERDKLAWLRAEIQKGIDAVDRGEYEEYDENTTKGLVEEIKQRGKQRLAAMKKARAR
jgi:antitoxin ParD1/3/4